MNEEERYEAYVKMMEELHPEMFTRPYGGFAIGEGWWTLVRVLCHNIQMHIDQVNSRRKYLLEKNEYNDKIPDAVPQVKVAQIKEKFGTLRFYYDGGDDYINGLVQMAESMSGVTCEQCGKPGRRVGKGYVQTLCDEHAAELEERMKQHE